MKWEKIDVNNSEMLSFYKVTEWAVKQYLKQKIKLDKIYTIHDIKFLSEDFYELVDVDFIEETDLSFLLDIVIENFPLEYLFATIGHFIVTGKFEPQDLIDNQNKILATFIKNEAFYVFQNYIVHISVVCKEKSIKGRDFIECFLE